MRVLMTTDMVGGVWTFTRELVSGLLEQGCSVALFSVGRLPSNEQLAWSSMMDERWGSNFSFQSADTPLEWMHKNGRSFAEAAPLLLRLADDFQPDVFHCNQFCFGGLPVAVPKIVTAHSDVLSWAACCREGPLENSRWLQQYQLLVCAGLDGADAVVAPTRWMLNAFGRNFALPGKRLVIPNGREIDAGVQRHRRLQSVTAGRLWDEAKSIATLFSAESPMPMLIAGESSCERMSAPAIAASAEFLGPLSQEALLAIFSESAVYICTSRYEPFGLAPLEAALCGCAVLANDVPSLREVWGDGALYFNDADALSRLLYALYDDEELLAKTQALSLERAQRYTREAMSSAYLSAYEELIVCKRDPMSLEVTPRKFSIAYFAHSLRSDWNNGNAHFLRGLLSNLSQLGHDVVVFEPAEGWSLRNLSEEDQGPSSLEKFAATYPGLLIRTYGISETAAPAFWREMLSEIDVVIVHEWNPPELANCLLEARRDLHFRLFFHDTHHRASSSPDQIRLFGIDRFDGVLAFGEALTSIYRDRFGIEHVWTLHEAADTQVFKPCFSVRRTTDVVWVGNWGDGERSAEIKQFLLTPASQLRDHRFCIYGVRYPDEGLAALQSAGVQYGGYLPNLDAPAAYAASRLTVHIPRQQYVNAMTGIPTIRVFEALACGIPLISAPWQDTENLFRSGDFLVVRNADEMRRAMEYLLDDPELAKAQAARGLETVLTRHTCRHRAQQLATIFEESLS